MPSNNTKMTFVVVEKSGSLKEVSVKEITVDEMYKKCGFRKGDDFECRTTWENVEVERIKYTVQLWGKIDGKSNTENKYDFPPPVDTSLFFGNCALVQLKKNKYVNLSKELWLKMYETLFGGFEDIDNEDKDEDEVDELENIKKEMKTKKGDYLKDGFVVDSDESDIVSGDSSDDDELLIEGIDENTDETSEDNELIEELDLVLDGSELEEEEYEYSDEE